MKKEKLRTGKEPEVADCKLCNGTGTRVAEAHFNFKSGMFKKADGSIPIPGESFVCNGCDGTGKITYGLRLQGPDGVWYSDEEFRTKYPGVFESAQEQFTRDLFGRFMEAMAKRVQESEREQGREITLDQARLAASRAYDGLPKDEQVRLFEEFWGLSSSDKPATKRGRTKKTR